MKSFSVRVLILAVSALIASQFMADLPDLTAMAFGASVCCYLFGPVFAKIGSVLTNAENVKELADFAEKIEKLIAAGNWDRARLLAEKVREGCK